MILGGTWGNKSSNSVANRVATLNDSFRSVDEIDFHCSRIDEIADSISEGIQRDSEMLTNGRDFARQLKSEPWFGFNNCDLVFVNSILRSLWIQMPSDHRHVHLAHFRSSQIAKTGSENRQKHPIR